MRSCQTRFEKTDTPAGDQVATRFPWWRTQRREITTDDFEVPFVIGDVRNSGSSAFRNTQPWPIYVDEIRFWTEDIDFQVDATLRAPFSQIHGRLSTTRRDFLIAELIPLSCWNTEVDRHLEGYLNGIDIRLPVPYYFAAGQHMNTQLRAMTEGLYANNTEFQVAIRGCDPVNGSPIVMGSRAIAPAPAAAVPTPVAGAQAVQPDSLVFDDGRDQGVRSMWIHDLQIGIRYLENAFNRTNAWRQMAIQIQPPEGPKWTDDWYTPLQALCEQVPAVELDQTAEDEPLNLYYNAPVIHRPPAPYELLPGDSLDIEIMTQFFNADATPTLWTAVKGWQEAH